MFRSILLLGLNFSIISQAYAQEKMLNLDLVKILPISQKMNYKKIPDWPKEMILQGPATQWEAIVFEGEELIGVMWKSAKGKLLLDGYPFDQMTQIIKGTLKLQAEGKAPITYKAGDVFMLPKGFKGIWEMPDEYEEFIIVRKDKYE